MRKGRHEKGRDVHRVPRRAFCQKFLIWSCFSRQGVGSIAVLPGTMTAGRYQQVLEDHLLPVAHQWFPGGDWTFIQDNAPCHKSFSTQAFMAQKGILCMDWPPYSPDLNAIENLWAILKEKIRQKSLNLVQIEVHREVKRIWTEDPGINVACENLIKSMPARIREVINNKGSTTSY